MEILFIFVADNVFTHISFFHPSCFRHKARQCWSPRWRHGFVYSSLDTFDGNMLFWLCVTLWILRISNEIPKFSIKYGIPLWKFSWNLILIVSIPRAVVAKSKQDRMELRLFFSLSSTYLLFILIKFTKRKYEVARKRIAFSNIVHFNLVVRATFVYSDHLVACLTFTFNFERTHTHTEILKHQRLFAPLGNLSMCFVCTESRTVQCTVCTCASRNANNDYEVLWHGFIFRIKSSSTLHYFRMDFW